MELEHHFTVPASVEQTWAAFNDPALVAPCFPGATLVSVEGDQFTGSAKIKLGPIAMQYSGTGTYVERDEQAWRAVIEAMGRDKRGNGTANARVIAQLSPDGDGTSVHVTTDLAVTGKPAQFGRGVMQDVSDKLLLQFVACLQTKLGASDAVPEMSDATDTGWQPSDRTADRASGPTAATPAATPTARPTARPATGPAARPEAAPALQADGELNLLRTIGAVLLTRYAARALGPVAFLVGYLLGRRSRR